MYGTPLMKYSILHSTIRTVCHIQLFKLYLALEVTPWIGMSLVNLCNFNLAQRL